MIFNDLSEPIGLARQLLYPWCLETREITREARHGSACHRTLAHWSRWLEVIGSQLGAVHVKDCRIEADGSKTLLPLGAGDMDYSAIRAFLANRAPAAPLLRDEVILPADTADVRYLRRMTDTV